MPGLNKTAPASMGRAYRNLRSLRAAHQLGQQEDSLDLSERFADLGENGIPAVFSGRGVRRHQEIEAGEAILHCLPQNRGRLGLPPEPSKVDVCVQVAAALHEQFFAMESPRRVGFLTQGCGYFARTSDDA